MSMIHAMANRSLFSTSRFITASNASAVEAIDATTIAVAGTTKAVACGSAGTILGGSAQIHNSQ